MKNFIRLLSLLMVLFQGKPARAQTHALGVGIGSASFGASLYYEEKRHFAHLYVSPMLDGRVNLDMGVRAAHRVDNPLTPYLGFGIVLEGQSPGVRLPLGVLLDLPQAEPVQFSLELAPIFLVERPSYVDLLFSIRIRLEEL